MYVGSLGPASPPDAPRQAPALVTDRYIRATRAAARRYHSYSIIARSLSTLSRLEVNRIRELAAIHLERPHARVRAMRGVTATLSM